MILEYYLTEGRSG